MRAYLLVSCLVIALPTFPQTVFKCTDAKGAISLQQTPCPGTGQRLDVRPSAAPPPPPSPNPIVDARAPQYSAKSAAEADKRAAAVSAGLAGGYPAVGMNMNQLAQVLGQPNKINYSDYGRGTQEQRIYDRGGRTFYVYTRDGLVTGIQHGQSAVRTTRNCPSELDIRNMETTASSSSLSDSQREHYQRQIRDMRACQ
jgi:hypothetical protein